MKKVVVFTMKQCGFCQQFKKMLKENNIKFINRDIDKHQEEYDLFRNAKNDLVPAFMIVDVENPSQSELFAPDIDYKDFTTAINIINERVII